PGVAPQVSPPSSSRMKIASYVGSESGSFAKGVRRFSRLFSAQVNDEPEELTTLPKPGFARMLHQGSGVSSSPSRQTTYCVPSSENPPRPFQKCSGGSSGAAFTGGSGAARRGARSGGQGGGYAERLSWLDSSPRSPRRTTRAQAARWSR